MFRYFFTQIWRQFRLQEQDVADCCSAINQENDGLYVELTTTSSDPNSNSDQILEISILYDQHVRFEDLIRIIPKSWLELERQKKLKLSIEYVYIPTYEFVVGSRENFSLKIID